MLPFHISRIHTQKGIFRLSGHWQGGEQGGTGLKVAAIDILGTDGWLALDSGSREIAVLIGELTPELLAHLKEKAQARG